MACRILVPQMWDWTHTPWWEVWSLNTTRLPRNPKFTLQRKKSACLPCARHCNTLPLTSASWKLFCVFLAHVPCGLWIVCAFSEDCFPFSGLPCLPETLLCLILLDITSGSTWHFSHLMGTLPLLWESLNTTASAVTCLPSWASLWLPESVSSLLAPWSSTRLFWMPRQFHCE